MSVNVPLQLLQQNMLMRWAARGSEWPGFFWLKAALLGLAWAYVWWQERGKPADPTPYKAPSGGNDDWDWDE